MTDTLRNAYAFVAWYRRMVMEGAVVANSYAIAQRPCSDYDLQEALEDAMGKDQPASATLAGTPRLSDTPTPSSIETAHYVSAPNGSSWVIRDKRKGEVIAFRPDHQSAQKAMESLESTGSLA